MQFVIWQFYISLGLSVGGDERFFPDYCVNSGRLKPWKSKSAKVSLAQLK